ncbi:hypothetical protein [Algoriphagus aquimarinus]|uniref:hypothetical protein n=1 Tax=Algoriphagus aquimarinus TaxID=237018 RepID=UPI0030DC6107|tara:strand:- start:24832 stop:25371 length:540 start_codon:yes stop_codon:yes gene_type:complete
MSILENGAEAPQNANQVVAVAPWKTDIYHAHWNSHEFVFMLNDGRMIEFNKPDEWMPSVNEGKHVKVKETREKGYQEKLTKLLADGNFDGMWDVLNSRKQGSDSVIINEESVIDRGNQVKERNEGAKIASYTEDDKQFIYGWKNSSLKPTNAEIASAFGTTSASVGKWIAEIKNAEKKS